MSSNETLGARLRNLLSPYKNLIAINKNDFGPWIDPQKFIESAEKNLQDLIDFSNSDEMEHNFVK